MRGFGSILLATAAVGCAPGPPDSPPSQRVAVEDMWRAFDAGETAAQKRFGGRPLTIEGTLTAISEPGSDKPILWLSTPGKASAPAFIDKGPVSLGLRGKVGSRVTLWCASAESLGATPYLYGCREP